MVRGLWLLLFIPLLASGQNAGTPVKGTMAATCMPRPGMKIDLGSLELFYDWGLRGSRYLEHQDIVMEVSSCAAPIQCADIKKATVVFDHFNANKRASGTYTLEFADGSKQNATFSVTRKKQQPKPVCE